MIKMIFSDFDETLLNYHSSKNYFDDYQVDILRRLNNNNIKFCIVTGRCVSFFEQFSNILPYVSYIISSNGSYIYDVKAKKSIFCKYIGIQELISLIDYVDNNGFGMLYNSNGIQYNNQVDIDYNSCEQVILSFGIDNLENVLDDIKNISYVKCNNICKRSDRYTIDVNDYRVSKGNGVKYLCEYLDIDVDDTICFGDSDNDLSMFKVVGTSIAMGNANIKIKNNANDVVLSCEEEGMFKYIDNNILNKFGR